MIDINNIKLIKWYVPLELNHSSYIFSALINFCSEKNVNFKISYKNLNKKGRISINNSKIEHSMLWYAKVNFIRVYLIDDTSKLLAFDLNDSSIFFPTEALKNADIVYKRCYQKKYIDCLPFEYRIKVHKMGLPFMVRPDKIISKYKLIFILYIFKFQELIKTDRLFFRRFLNFVKLPYKQWVTFLNTRTVKDFDNISNKELSNLIFYQKRLFPNEIDDDTKEVHKQRVEIVNLLKTKLPLNFKGGLKKDPITIKLYPESISNIDGDPMAFLKAMKECGICIYTRGLVQSTGWTLPEFLSQGKCIVAEKIDIELPFPLKNNFNIIFFESNEELIEICEHLISNISEINRIGKNARNYYEKYVTPSIFIENILKQI